MFFILIFPATLTISAVLLLRASAIQTFLTNEIAAYLSDKLKTKITVGGVNVEFFKTVVLEDLYIEDLHNDTLLHTLQLKADIKNFDFDKNKIVFSKIAFHDMTLNIKKYQGEENFNLQFIIDALKIKQEDTLTDPLYLASENILFVNSAFRLKDENKNKITTGINYADLNITDLNVGLEDVILHSDTISGIIERLSCSDHSGFQLINFHAAAKVMPVGMILNELLIVTPSSEVRTTLSFKYNGYPDFKDFVNKVYINSYFEKSKAGMDDIAYFAPYFFGLHEHLNLSGNVNGKIANLKGKNIEIDFGNASRFAGDFSFSGLPDFNETFIHLTVKEISTNQQDLKNIPVPPFKERKFLNVPSNIASLGNLGFEGEFTGFPNDFVAYGNFSTGLGSFSSDISLSEDHVSKKIRYKGNLAFKKFDIGKYAGIERYAGMAGAEVHIDGSGFKKNEAVLKGMINYVETNNYTYKNVKVEGKLEEKRFNGFFAANDENIDLLFNGKIDFNEQPPVFNFEAELNKANLYKLGIMKRDSSSYVSFKVVSDLIGNNIDNMQGSVDITKLVYKNRKNNYPQGDINFYSTIANGERRINLKSDLADSEIKGKFNLASLGRSFKKFVAHFIPSYIDNDSIMSAAGTKQDFSFSFHFKDSGNMLKLIKSPFETQNGISVNGRFNESNNEIEIKAAADHIMVKDKEFRNIVANVSSGLSDNNDLLLSIGCGQFLINDSLHLDNISITGSAGNDSASFGLSWKNEMKKTVYSGDLKVDLNFSSAVVDAVKQKKIELTFQPSEIVIADTVWSIAKSGKFILQSADTLSKNIYVTGFAFSSGEQSISAEGELNNIPDGTPTPDNKKPTKPMHGSIILNMKDIQLAVLNKFIRDRSLNIAGAVNGEIIILPEVITGGNGLMAKLRINKLNINDYELGDMLFNSEFDNESKTIHMIGSIEKNNFESLKINGSYRIMAETERRDEKMRFDIEVNKLKISLLEPLVKNIFSDISGFATGKLLLSGSFKDVDLTGKLFVQRGSFFVNFLNTRYSFTNEVLFDKSWIGFENIELNDLHGNHAIANGKIYHRNFRDMMFDINVKTDNLYCLDTKANNNEQFYGQAYLSGIARITGPPKNVIMNITATTTKGTHIYIPLGDEEEIKESGLITFIKYEDEKTDKKKEVRNVSNKSGLQMNAELEITPEAEIQLIFDEAAGDILKGRGTGNLRLEIDRAGDFNMYGTYHIDHGDYLFTLKNIINKRFRVEKGGVIRWNGSPYEALVDISSVYTLRASLYDLTLDPAYKKRVQVECRLRMTDKLLNPNITFGVDIPKTDESVRSNVNTILSSEQQLNKQVFSLLVLGRFQYAGGLYSLETGGGVGANSSELLSNQLSNWLSQISNEFDIGVKYRPGDEISDKELELALSTQLFNDRLYIDGSVANNPDAANTQTSSIVGDFNLEYMLTQDGRWRINAFNESNDYYLNTDQGPYKQGIGISYRKEFYKFKELFRKK